MVPSEGDMHVWSGGHVEVYIAVASTWSWGCRSATAMGAWSRKHMGARVVALVGARTNVQGHASQCQFPGTRNVASLGLG